MEIKPESSQEIRFIIKEINWLKVFAIGSLIILFVLGAFFAGIQIGKRLAESVNQKTYVPKDSELGLIKEPTPALEPTTGTTLAPTEPVVTKSPSVAAVKIVPANTDGWKKVQNNGVHFKIPAFASCNNDTECTEVSYPIVHEGKNLLPARILVGVSDYQGGSRRAQYFKNIASYEECRPIYVESRFGNVDALQIAIDGGWCQGGYDGAIVAVVGNKFVTIGPGLSYNENKEISRWSERDTLISTLSVN